MKKSLRAMLVAAAVSAGALAASGGAMAAGPTGNFAKFNHCPYTNTNVFQCVYSTTSSGSFQLGNASVPITSSTPITLQGGVSTTPPGSSFSTFYGAVGADTLSRTRLNVPGGLIGLVSTGGWSGLLIDLFNAAVRSVNGVTATAELVGPVQFSGFNFLTGGGTAIGLPVRIHLENPFLGSNCYIGSSSTPVRLNLITGTTAPPAPNRPISGSPGTIDSTDDGAILSFTANKLVDNSFAAPAASDCGYLLLDKLLITGGVNLREGLPSAAGRNSAILQGDTYLGNAAAVAASVQ